MATSEGIPSSIDIEFLELNDNPYITLYLYFISSIQHTDHGINDYHYLRRSFTLTESIQPSTKKKSHWKYTSPIAFLTL